MDPSTTSKQCVYALNVSLIPGFNLRWVIYDIKEKTMRCEFAIAVFWLNAGTQNIYWIFDEGEEVLLNPKWSEARGE